MRCVDLELAQSPFELVVGSTDQREFELREHSCNRSTLPHERRQLVPRNRIDLRAPGPAVEMRRVEARLTDASGDQAMVAAVRRKPELAHDIREGE
jgi:hypothetical protein